MRKPENIVLTIVGSVVAGGIALKACAPSHRVSTYSSRPRETMAQSLQRAEAALPWREYRQDEFVTGAGYFHPMAQGFYLYPVNHFLSGKGYYHAGQWLTSPAKVNLFSAKPSLAEMKRLRQLLAEKYQQEAPVASSGGSGYRGSSFRSSGSSWRSSGGYTGSSSTDYSSTSPRSSSSSSSSSGSRSFFGGFGGGGSSSS
jgi:hypothetical protein